MRFPFIDRRSIARVLFVVAAMYGASGHALVIESKSGQRAAPVVAGPLAETKANEKFRKGIEASLKGDIALAKSHYLAAIRLDPKFAPAMIGLADIAQKQGDLPQAENYLKQAEATAPQTAAVHIARGRFLLSTRQFEKAEFSFKQARDLSPNSITPLLELGDLYLRDTSRRNDALASFAAAVDLEPDNKYAVYSYGVALALVGRRDNALSAFEKAAALAPRDPAPLRAAGRLHLEAGATDKALKAFDLGLKRQPKFVPLMLDRGDALAQQGKWTEAIGQFAAAVRAAPASAEVQVKLGDAYQGAKQWDKAQAAYARAIELDEKNPLAYNNLAWLLVQRGGSPAKAVEAANKAVALSPNSAPFIDTLGLAQRAAGNLPAAVESLQRATQIEPKVSEFQLHYGIILVDLKRIVEARQALIQALDPRFPQIADEAKRLLRSLPER